MALTRPNAIVFQEYKEFSVTPTIPDLNVLVVGPCYQILDYLDDKTDCYADTYGSDADSNNPVVTTTAVDIQTPPNVDAGAILKDDSVKIFFDNYRVALKEVTDSTGQAAGLATFWANDNLFRGADVTTAVYNANLLGVQAGDKLITNQGDPASTSDIVRTVKELVFVLRSTGSAPNHDSVGTDTGDIITITSDAAGTPRNGTYTVKKKYVESGSSVALAIEIEPTGASNLIGTSANAHMVITAPDGTVKYDSTTGSPVGLRDECWLRTTTDFAVANSGTAGFRLWRIERELNDLELEATSYEVDAETKVVTVDAALTDSVLVRGTATALRITHADIYMEYMALRQDLQNITDIESTPDLAVYLGKYDARNPLHVGASVAKQNTTTKVRVYGVASDDIAGYGDFIDRISAEKYVYAVVPLTYDVSIIGALKLMAENYADPTYCLDNGIKQKFRAVIGALELATQKEVIAAIGGGTTSQQVGSAPSGTRLFTVTADVAQHYDLSADGVLPGDTITVLHVGGTASYTVSHVNSATACEIDQSVTVPLVLDASSKLNIYVGATTVKRMTVELSNVGTGTTFSIANGALDALYNIISVPTADFSNVVPGDIIQIPSDPEVNTWTTYDSWVVSLVESTTRLRVVNEGSDTSTVANELPHLVKRVTATDRVVTSGSVYMKVVRNMSKSEQVTNMLATAQGFASKRTLLVYPHSCDVSGLVDGSLARTSPTVKMTAGHQPGYYLACIVGGQTAGQPSQQGFTNLSGIGISRVYYASDYFTEEQLTDLSNGGVYVFVQDTTSSQPYTIHEVTTDVVSLETGEYMAVKNLDFISMTFLETLRDFLGKWNINPDTIKYVHQGCTATVTNLKSRYVAKIGAPLISATIDSVAQSDISEDRIEAYIGVVQPMTLNVIGLHLVA
jgi:hypothetical protein